MTQERPKPYIGISGVSESKLHGPNMQHWLMDQFIRAGLENEGNHHHERQLLLGVKAVHKTQYLDIENRYGREWYPVGAKEFESALDIGGIQALKTAQIYFDANQIAHQEYRDEFIKRICLRGRYWLNALQFDLLPWHQDEAMLPFLEKVRQETGHAIILQAHGESMHQLGPERLTKTLGRYAHALDYILFDASHGKGVRLNTDALLPFLHSSYESTVLRGVGFGVAGGLSADSVRDEMPKLLENYSDLSWDAEGKLHHQRPDGSYGFDWTAAKHYLQASADVIKALPRERL